MATVFRRCGCRRPNGTRYPLLAERATSEQREATCPRLLSDPKHGGWGFFFNGPRDPKTGQARKVRKSGFALKREALEACARALAESTDKDAQHDAVQDRSFAEWLTEWFERRERRDFAPQHSRCMPLH